MEGCGRHRAYASDVSVGDSVKALVESKHPSARSFWQQLPKAIHGAPGAYSTLCTTSATSFLRHGPQSSHPGQTEAYLETATTRIASSQMPNQQSLKHPSYPKVSRGVWPCSLTMSS